MSSPREALEAFADAGQNPDLLLESLLARFNLFEAMGVVRHELRHSDFLAYLLNPSQHHGLRAIFLKELLQVVLLTMEGDGAISPSNVDAWDLSQATVQREWHHIDILAVDDVTVSPSSSKTRLALANTPASLTDIMLTFLATAPAIRL